MTLLRDLRDFDFDLVLRVLRLPPTLPAPAPLIFDDDVVVAAPVDGKLNMLYIIDAGVLLLTGTFFVILLELDGVSATVAAEAARLALLLLFSLRLLFVPTVLGIVTFALGRGGAAPDILY